MMKNCGKNLIPSSNFVDTDPEWERKGLNYLKIRIFFAEENVCPDWPFFDIENASWEECFFQWRRVGKVIRQFGLESGSDQYEDYFIDAVEQNYGTRQEIYEQIQVLEEKNADLTGKENKKKKLDK